MNNVKPNPDRPSSSTPADEKPAAWDRQGAAADAADSDH